MLLVALATLQYRWLGEVSRAEGERMRASRVESALANIGLVDMKRDDLAYGEHAAAPGAVAGPN